MVRIRNFAKFSRKYAQQIHFWRGAFVFIPVHPNLIFRYLAWFPPAAIAFPILLPLYCYVSSAFARSFSRVYYTHTPHTSSTPSSSCLQLASIFFELNFSGSQDKRMSEVLLRCKSQGGWGCRPIDRMIEGLASGKNDPQSSVKTVYAGSKKRFGFEKAK